MRLPPLLEEALARLPRGLHAHVQRVRRTARELAEPLGLDLELVDQAAAAHDVARAVAAEELLAEARRHGLPVSLVEAHHPVLLHGPVGAERLRSGLGVTEPQVLEAVRWHSTAGPGLGPLALVIFLADKLDPSKASRYPQIEEVRALAPTDLEGAVAVFLAGELERLLRSGGLIHVASLEARNELLVRRKRL